MTLEEQVLSSFPGSANPCSLNTHPSYTFLLTWPLYVLESVHASTLQSKKLFQIMA